MKFKKLSSRAGHIMQFKITLNDIKPAIWRRIQIPASATVWDLEVAIISAMGWGGGHLHAFYFYDKISHQRTAISARLSDEFLEKDDLDSRKVKMLDWFNQPRRQAIFTYDFGDSWDHTVALERTAEAEPGAEYLRCIGGARACPPEDCGGAGGYDNLLEIIANPKHKEYRDMMEWLGGEYNPEEFSAAEVMFDDPDEVYKSVKSYF